MENFGKMLQAIDNGKRKTSSRDIIVNNIRRLYNRCYGEDPEDVSQISAMVEDVGHTFACLQSSWDGKKLSHSTMLSYTNALIVANEVLNLSMKDTYADLETELQVRRADAQRKNPIKNTKISRGDLEEIRDDLMEKSSKSKTNLKNYILFHILSKYPFRLESATLKPIHYDDFIKLEDKGITNYLVVNDDRMMFSFNGYKTSKKFGSREIECDDILCDLFTEYLAKDKIADEYLFFKASEGTEEKIQEKMRNNLSVWTKRLLKKYDITASATDITKLLITEIWDTGTTQDKIKYAMWRGHEVQTASRVYATQL